MRQKENIQPAVRTIQILDISTCVMCAGVCVVIYSDWVHDVIVQQFSVVLESASYLG